MKKLLCVLFVFLILTACSKPSNETVISKFPLSVEQESKYNSDIKKLLNEKAWEANEEIPFYKIMLPKGIKNTYYEDILKKSKDSGYDMTSYLGTEVMEGIVNIKYINGDVAGVGHFLFAQDKMIGAYYMYGNYIYSLNEKEVFTKPLEWQNVENLDKKQKYQQIKINLPNFDNLVYCGKYDDNITYMFGIEGDKLKLYTLDVDKLVENNEISLEGLYIISMFFKDVDNDGKSELALLLSNTKDYKAKSAPSKLTIYGIDGGLKLKYNIDFEYPMCSTDFDGKDIIVTSKDSIQMYTIKKDNLSKVYSYNKIGGYLKVVDIDNSGRLNYILLDSEGKDLYVFQKDNGFEEIWRSYNSNPTYSGKMQIGDLNHDGVKEIYLDGKDGNIRKIVLQKDGFLDEEIIKNHKYFIGDFNCDGKSEYFDLYKKAIIYNY